MGIERMRFDIIKYYMYILFYNEKDYYIADVIGSDDIRRKTKIPYRIVGI